MTVYDCRDPVQRDRGVAAAVAAVKRGELVVLPTDTLYSVACDAFKKTAVDALFRAKERGRDLPLVVMVGARRTFDGLVHRMPKAARALADAFWPGPLTLIVSQARSLSWDLGDTGDTVAVRMPLHPVALEVLREIGPMASTTANKPGNPPAATVAGAQQLGTSVRVYLDGGTGPVGVASTIVDLVGETPRLVRAGALSAERIREVVPDLELPEPVES